MTPPTRSPSPEADAASPADDAAAVVAFWRQAGPQAWFRKDTAFDTAFRERFLALHMAAARRECDGWARTAEGGLALLVLLDQFPRNAFRGTGHMYATDALARHFARGTADSGRHLQVEPALRLFCYLPFSHSEDIADQRRAVELNRALGDESLAHAEQHLRIVERFGRFPHRNPMLGRETTPEEQAFLEGGGFAG